MEDGRPPQHTFKTPEEVHRQLYFEVLGTAATSVDCRFSPSVFKYMHDVDDFVTGQQNCESIIEFHGDDLDETRATLHQDVCIDIAKQQGVCLQRFDDVVHFIQSDKGRHVTRDDQTH